jgi:hypothetical protein
MNPRRRRHNKRARRWRIERVKEDAPIVVRTHVLRENA